MHSGELYQLLKCLLLSNKDICDNKYVDEVLVQLKINILYQIMFSIYWYKLIEILRETVMANFI